MRAREEHDNMIRRRLDSAGSETDDEDVEDDEMLVGQDDDDAGGAKRMYPCLNVFWTPIRMYFSCLLKFMFQVVDHVRNVFLMFF